jgi:hypothetical protein
MGQGPLLGSTDPRRSGSRRFSRHVEPGWQSETVASQTGSESGSDSSRKEFPLSLGTWFQTISVNFGRTV